MSKLKTFLLLSLIMSTTLFAQKGASVEHLSAPEFKKAIESKKYLLIDVRTSDEFAYGHINGAINIDVNDADFVKKVKAKTANQKMVALYCRSGRRSKMATSLIEPLKLTVVELNEGIMSWQNAGFKLGN